MDIVDRDDNRLVSSEQLQRATNRDPERPRIDAVPCRLFAEERNLERATPGCRQRRQHLVEYVVEEIAQANVGEAAVGLRRSRNEDAQPARTSMVDAR